MHAHACSVCGMIKAEAEVWFSLAENRWQDRLKIMRWDENTAKLDATYHACGAEHVREFLYAWVTSGKLPCSVKSSASLSFEGSHPEMQSFGELSIHRHGLKSTPEGLKSMLDKVISALKREFEPLEDQLPPKIQPQKISFQASAAHAS